MEIRWLKKPVTLRTTDGRCGGPVREMKSHVTVLQILKTPFGEWEDVPTVIESTQHETSKGDK